MKKGDEVVITGGDYRVGERAIVLSESPTGRPGAIWVQAVVGEDLLLYREEYRLVSPLEQLAEQAK